MKKLRIGVVGLGMGIHHIMNYRTHAGCEVVALMDTDSNRLAEVSEKFQVPNCYTDMKQMLKQENLDLVSVCTPNKFHKPLTIQALESGCHVLCEKPMAMNSREARAMLEAAKVANKRIMINFSYRFTEQATALKKQVESGVLGDIYFGRTVWHRRRGLPGFGGWFGTKALAGGGPLIDLGVHRLDLALWLMGYPRPVWVMGSSYNHIASELAERSNKHFDVEDLAVGLIRFENGATLEIEASWAANIAENELMETRLLGTKGGLLQKNRNEGYEMDAEMFVEREGSQFDLKLHPPVPSVQNPQFHFVDAILNNRPHIATGEEGLIVMELLDAIYRSAKQGKPVKI